MNQRAFDEQLPAFQEMWREAFLSVAEDVDRLSRDVGEKVADDPLASIGMVINPVPKEKGAEKSKGATSSSSATKRRRKEEREKEAAAAALDPFARRRTRPKSYWSIGAELESSETPGSSATDERAAAIAAAAPRVGEYQCQSCESDNTSFDIIGGAAVGTRKAETFGKKDAPELILRSASARRKTKGSRDASAAGRLALSIFDLPPGLLADVNGVKAHDGAVLSSQDQAAAGSRIVHPETGTTTTTSAVQGETRGLTCIRCGLQFADDRPAQVLHFKSDLHLTNLRRQLAGKPPISQQQLDDEAAAGAAAVGGDAGVGAAGAGADGESSSDTGSDQAAGTADRGGPGLEDVAEEGTDIDVDGGMLASIDDGDGVESGHRRGRVKVGFSLQEGPRLTFVPRGSGWAFSLSSAALGMERGDDPWARLDDLVGDEGSGMNRLWAVVILRSGKFAAAVFEGQSVLCHKVFRRYTIRAKRGGSQSSYDSGGRKAQSAGAALRRYGEQALREDARALLKEWEEPLKACRVVLTSVPKGMRAVLFDGKDAPFDRKDPRLRPVPFAVGKPVFEEVVAVHTRVTSIIFSDAATVSFDDPKPASKRQEMSKAGGGTERVNEKESEAAAGPVVIHNFDADLCPPSVKLIEACQQGDVDAAAMLLDRLELNNDAAAAAGAPAPPVGVLPISGGAPAVAPGATAPGWTAEEVLNHPDGFERLMTPLHVAAAGGHVAVLGLLLQRGANPLAEDVRGRVPYLLASNKDTRDAFRRARAGLPERWDWDAARVPEPLTEELEQRQKEKQKEKEKEKKRRAKLRKKAEKGRAEEEARQRKAKEDAEAEDRRKRGLAAAGHCDACGKSKFELDAPFVIADFDREGVIDDKVYASMRSGGYWKRNPKANRLFLVLDNISAPLEDDVELEVSYQPHFNTITKTGDANFSKIPHAVAELIDNSIQATTDNSGPRTVEVEVELGGKGGSFLIVRDNGKGMNASDLKDFATYFLTQENRGVSGPQGSSTPAFVEPSPSSQGNANGIQGGGGGGAGGLQSANGKGKGKGPAPRKMPTSVGKTKGSICSGFISKFGVGALQAGFYIGSCLTVITKTARLPDVCEFVMNEAEFERRAETNAAMFRDKITRRNPGKSRKESTEAEKNAPSKDLLDRLRSEEVGKDHFTYIVLTLRDQHVEWFTHHERGSLKQELASIYHYYLHPENCPDGILRDDDELSDAEEAAGAGAGGAVREENGYTNGSSISSRMTQGTQPLDITYTRRNRSGQPPDVVRLGDVDDDVESRLNSTRKDSFLFHMEVLHPMQNPRGEEMKRLPVTGVIHYYPYDGDKETRPALRPDEEDDESITVEAFWEGRRVPESNAATLSFFPSSKLSKKEREALGSSWRRRIKGMLFFDWNFPISNNKLKLQFPEGDLNTALNAKYVLPKPPAVIYPGFRGRNIQKEFREWLIKCHETLDIEYRFDDKMPTPQNSKHDKWRKMTFGKGGSTFVSDTRVKLPLMKPNVYGVINFFRTEADEDEEEGRGHRAMFCLQRFPEDVFGDDDQKMYPITELDPAKSLISTDDWDKAMSAYRKQLPTSMRVQMTEADRSLPKRLTIRTGKAESTKISVQIMDGSKKPMVQIPQGKGLRVLSILERAGADGEDERVLLCVAKPFTGKLYDKMYFFEPMNIKEPGEYTWTVAVAKEGESGEGREVHMLETGCHISVLPGNPTKAFLEGDDWDVTIPLGDPCWLPAFAVKLRDQSKCVCPMRSYKSVTVSCSEPGAFDVEHVTSRSATHEMALGKSASDAAGPLEYDDHSWKLVPKQAGLLSAVEYSRREIEFEVAVVAHIQQDRPEDEDEKVFKNTFEINFQPGTPAELVLLSPVPDGGGGPVVTGDAGCALPPFSLMAMDHCGNRTAPSHNEAWQVSLEITAANASAANDIGPEFAGPVREKVAAGAASFNDAVVKWERPLKADGELAPGTPAELVLLSPVADGGGGPVVTGDAGCALPPFSLMAMDHCGNRTAPSHNEAWQVSLEITAANASAANDIGPEFAGPVREKVAAGAASFNDAVVKWERPLKADGELAVVEASLFIGTSSKNAKQVASTSFTVKVMPSKVPFRAVVCLDGNAWPSPEEVENAPAAGTAAAKAADSVAVRRSYPAGSVISGLHLRLYDQGGNELLVGKDSFEASNKEAVTCSWEAAWRWPSKDASKGMGYDLLPDIKVPTQLSRLANGIHHAKVVVNPKPVGAGAAMPLPAEFAFQVHAGPVSRWMAVKASAGNKITDNVGPLEVTAGGDASACYESFKRVVRGFVPVDEFGNLVKNVPRAPEIKIEGMPLTNLLPEHHCKLLKPPKPNGVYQFPRSLNLEGPPGQSGHLLIMCSSGEAMSEGGASAGAGAGGGGSGSGSGSGGGVADETRVLRLPVSIKAGDPVKLLIRSPGLGAEEFSDTIRTTQLAGFKVDDLEVKLVDKNGFPSSIGPRGVRIMVTPQGTLAEAGGSSPRGSKRNSAAAKKDLSKKATHNPETTMPKFSLDLKIQGQGQGDPRRSGGGGGGGSSNSSSSREADRAEQERAANEKAGVALVVRAEASDVDIAGASIYWTRKRTSAVTKVNLAALKPSTSTSASASTTPTLQQPAMLPTVIGQRARQTGLVRPVDGPLPSLVVWLDTDNGSPCEPPPESVSFTMTSVASSAGPSQTFTNLYEAPVAAPESVNKPNAKIYHPKRDVMEQAVGEHKIVCTYVEHRALATQDMQGQEHEMLAETTLRVVAGSPFKLEPMPDDAGLFHSLSASNQEALNARDEDEAAKNARQLVEKTFRFTANDCRGNHAGHIKGPVRMRIENLDGVDVPAAEMPRLEDADAAGYVLADPTATGVFLFEENWLQPGVGSKEGDYKLVVDSAGDPGLQSWSTTFHFETDQKRLNSIREVKARLKPLEDKLDRYKAAHHAASTRESSALEQAREAFNRLPPSLRCPVGLENGNYAASVDEARRLLSGLEQDLRERANVRPRPMKFESGRMRPEDEQAIRPVGYIVQLGYVDNEYLAKLLSMKGGSKMKAVYVDTKAQLDMVRKAQAGGFCKESVATFRVPGENRPRNAAEMAAKQLPLRNLKAQGFKGYLANMIQLPEDQEHLRDTLFSALYGSMVMFDTHDNAHAYQVRCKRSGNIALPILVEEDGASLERNGYMPPAKDPEVLNRLKQVYGAMPPHLTPEFKKTDQYIKQLKNLIRALEQVLHAETEVTEVERSHDADGWRQEMSALTKELEDLMSRGTPARTGAGGGSARSRGGAQSTRASGGGGSSSGKRSRSSEGGRSGGRASKKKKGSETASAKTRGTQSKRAKR
eukprot:g3816.t1